MPELGRFARELRARLWKPSVREEVRDEIDAHLEMLERDLVARGLTPDAARAAARGSGVTGSHAGFRFLCLRA